MELKILNPYEPTITSPIFRDVANARINSVSRIFVWIGLLGSLIYIPMVIVCLVSLVVHLVSRPTSNSTIYDLLAIALATAVNSAILVLWLTFIVTARQIRRRIYRVRTRALVLAIVLSLGFPVLTIPGIMCFRWLRQFFHDGNREPTRY
jgi:hypothetical protein